MSSRWHVQDGHLSIMKNRDWHTMYSISVRPGRSRYLGVCLRVASYMSVGSVGGIKSGLHNESRRYLGCTGREGSCGYIKNISHSFDSSPCQLHIFGSFHHWNGVFCSYALRMKGPIPKPVLLHVVLEDSHQEESQQDSDPGRRSQRRSWTKS